MTNSLIYDCSVGSCIRALNNVSSMLDKAEAYAAEKKFDIDVLIQSRLAPDMFPLGAQIFIACTFAKNLGCRLAGQEPPDYERGPVNLDAARALIKRTIDILTAIKPEALNGAETRQITFSTSPTTTETQPGAIYMNKFAMPNIMFHVTTVYALLRHNGVPLGKRDFIGPLN
ncbi:MAG TPA: DUF1993 domain-containing protein [Caulobacterales bacterium]|nr:DUF1993 domain-containing protein [Caulobacterales bacterium]